MLERLKSVARRMGIAPVPTPVLVIGLVVCVAVAALGFLRWGKPAGSAEAAPTEASLASAEPTAVVAAATEPTVPPKPEMIFVHVVGAVMRPGVYEIELGARLADAIKLAGGLTGDAEEAAVNLARQVADGEQIVVPTQDEWEAAPAQAAAPGASPAAPPRGGTPPAASPPPSPGTPALVNVNTADAATLETLPGVGPVIAQRIIQDREQNGPFASVDELVRVSGIGDKTLESLRPYVTVR